MGNKKNVLFLCTGNSCRSQMGEGWGWALKSKYFNFYSAGTKKHGLNPKAIQVMEECGIDIRSQESKTIEELPDVKMDYIITVCSDAHERCPYFPTGKVVHVGFDDPPRLTKGMEDENEILAVYRRVRDEIKEVVLHLENYIEERV